MNKLFRSFISITISILLASCSDRKEQENFVVSSLEDLKGKTIAVVGGTVQDLNVSENCPDSDIMRFEREAETYLMVETGKACAALTPDISWVMAQDSYQNIVAVGDKINPVPIGFGFNKKSTALRDEFNEFLKEYLAETDLEALISDWADPDSDRRMPGLDEVSGENGTLNCVVSTISPPYTFVKNGEIAGIEPEIIAKFAISRNMKWNFVDVSFSGMISYIQSGKAEVGCSIICITPERQQSINFSDPWYYCASIILVNKKNAPEGLENNVDSEKKPVWESLKENLNKTLVKEDRYLMILDGLKVTVLISILAALFGTLLGMLLCFTSMRRNKFISKASNIFIEFMRCMPQVVFLMIMFYIIFGKSDIDGVWVAIIAFSLCFGAYTSVIFRSSLQSIDKGQNEAALSMGFSRIKAFTKIIMPQAIQRALPVYKGEFIGLVKATSIVGYIAVFDLTKAGDIIRSRTYDAFFSLIMITILYFLIIWALTVILKFIEKRTQPKRKKYFK